MARWLLFLTLASLVRLRTKVAPIASNAYWKVWDVTCNIKHKVKSILGKRRRDDVEEGLAAEPRRCLAARCLATLPVDQDPRDQWCDDCHTLVREGNIRYHRYTKGQPEQLLGRIEQGLLYGNLTVDEFNAGYWLCRWAFRNDTGDHRSPILDCIREYKALPPPERAAYYNFMSEHNVDIDMVEAVANHEFSYLPWVQPDPEIYDPFFEANFQLRTQRQQIIDDLVEEVRYTLDVQIVRADMDVEPYFRGINRSFRDWYDTYIGGRTAHEDHIKALSRTHHGELLDHVVQTYLVWLRDECAAHPPVTRDIGRITHRHFMRDWMQYIPVPYNGGGDWDDEEQ